MRATGRTGAKVFAAAEASSIGQDERRSAEASCQGVMVGRPQLCVRLTALSLRQDRYGLRSLSCSATPAKATAAALPLTTRLCSAGVAPAASINAPAKAIATPPIMLMAPTRQPSWAILNQGGSGLRAFMVRPIGRFAAGACNGEAVSD